MSKKTINSKELAALLNGREYGSEITTKEALLAKVNRLVVVYGASDDLIEFEGAISDEAGCHESGTIRLNKTGVLESADESSSCGECPHYSDYISDSSTIEAVWRKGDYYWQYKTDIPHETFEILERGMKFCKGIVFSLNDVGRTGKSGLDVTKLSDVELYVLSEVMCRDIHYAQPQMGEAFDNMKIAVNEEVSKRSFFKD